MISAYAPTLASTLESKDEFYLQLCESTCSVPAGDSIALIGDLNAIVGSHCSADSILPKVLKKGGDVLATELHVILSTCWQSRSVPQDLKDASIITLTKNKGSQLDCSNYL